MIERSRRPLLVALALATALRVGVFVVLAIWPLANEAGHAVSPLLLQRGIDMGFYEEVRATLFGEEARDLISGFANFYSLANPASMFVSAPMLPILLELFSYQAGNTLPLAVFYLALGIALVALWLGWLNNRGLGQWWLYLFALLPNPVWLTVNISTDLLFAFIFSLFYFFYFRRQNFINFTVVFAFLLAILAVFSRPNGITLLLFVFADTSLRYFFSSDRPRLLVLLVGGILLVPVSVFYLPQFLVYFDMSDATPYFGIPQNAYLEGVFSGLPEWLDKLVSWVALIISKILYVVGLRPSYGETPVELVLVRAAPGLLFLPGLIYGLLFSDRTHRLLMFLFLLPIFLGATQDRYNLPIQPLLFYFGVCAYYAVWKWLGLAPSTVEDESSELARFDPLIVKRDRR